MKKFTCCLLLLSFLLVALPVWAANTETQEGNVINVKLDGSTAWDSRINHPDGLAIFAILFEPSATTDKLVVRHNGAQGNKIFAGSLQSLYPGTVLFKPYIVAGDCTLGTPANATVIIILK